MLSLESVSNKTLTLHGLFEAQVERTPEAIALVFDRDQLTYSELNERANQLAHYLRSFNVAPEMLVGICIERSIEMIVGMLGILKAGGAFVPLDPSYPPERLAFILAETKVEVLVTLKKLLAGIPVPQGHLICLDAESFNIAAKSKNNPKSGVQSDNLAYTIYTSGSTGKPKGVMVNHQAICQGFLWMQEIFPITQQDRILQKLPLTFDFSFWELFWPLMTGACVLLAQPGGEKDSAYLVKLIARQKISILVFVPSVLQVFLSEEGLKTCKNIRMVFTGGEPLTSALKARFFNLLPNCQLYDLFGATENIIVTYWPCQPEEKLSSFPQGRPFPNLSIYVVNEQLQPVPVGETGELLVGGWGLARGYLNRPELTAQKFISNPFKDKIQERLYRTGDRVRYLSDGTIEILGRIDHQVKIRGFRIELGEIEEKLGKHPAVKQVAVIAREDVPGDKRLVAYVVLHSSEESEPKSISSLRHFLEQQLPDYMMPAVFVVLNQMPMTPNGKVDRLALPTPDKSRPELETTLVTPKTETEKLIAQVWIEVLGLDVVGIHDNFFELGGHSLLLTQIHNKLAEMFGMELSTMALVQNPTIHALAQHLNETDFKQSAVNVGEQNNKLTLKSIAEQQLQHRQENLPLSFAQQQMWLLSQLEPNNPFYSELEALRLKGSLNVIALEQSINKIIQRHSALRTNFVTVDGQPVQVIATSLTLKMSVVDLTDLPSSEKEVSAQRLATAQAQQPFDLATDPLIQTTLLKQKDTEHILLLKIHHIVWDGWSMDVFVRELAAFYTSFCNGLSPEFPSLPIQYADFAVWQRQWLTKEVLSSQLAYWKQQLEGAPALLELPTDRVRPSIQTYRGAHQRMALSIELTRALMSLSQRQKVTLFMTLLTAFQTLLYRYTGQTDICVGTPHANRSRPEIDSLIGFFVNTLVLRTCLSGNPSFEDVLSRVRDVALGAYAHQDLPFEKLVEELKLERDLSYTPLVQVMLVLNEPMPQIQMAGLTVSWLAVETATAKFDLSLAFFNTASGLIGEWEYNTDLFDATTIARMSGHFQTLLKGIVTNPQQRVSQLPLLTERERHQLLVEWNNTTKEYPIDKCIHQLFEEQVERSPDAIAVVFEEEQLTYRELNQRANRIAHHLITLGVEPEVLVGICVERSPLMVVGLLGILKAGGAYVPLDPAYPGERLAYMLSDSGVTVLLTTQQLVDSLPNSRAQVICLDADWQNIGAQSEENPLIEVKASNLAYMIYTSGSTGSPKGVMIEHRSLVNFTETAKSQYGYCSRDRSGQFASISFDAAAGEIYPCLTSGGTLVLGASEILSSVSKFVQKCREWQLTVLILPTAYWHSFTSELASTTETIPSSVRLVIIGGEAALAETLKLWQKCVDDKLRCHKLEPPLLINAYGPSETTVDATTLKLSEFLPAQERAFLPIGRPISNVKAYILDQYLQPVPIGVSGELYIGGVCLARGYLNRLDLTAEKFITNPFQKSECLYKTGDCARYLPDGNIEFLGRIDNQVKIRGFRIELGEIESSLACHPAIQETVVLAREDIPGRKYLAAYIVMSQHSTTSSELRGFLKQKLPDYMIPSTFVMLSALPLTPNGKVDRRALPTPDLRAELQLSFIAPRTPIEEMVASIWVSVLGIELVGAHDNFFELGGHSLLATQVISRMRVTLGVELPLRSLFEAPTVAELAQRVEIALKSGHSIQAEPLLPIPRSAEIPLSFAQERLWFLDQLQPNSSFYNIPLALRLSGQLNIAALQSSINEIIRRHEALRTNFAKVGGQPVQVIASTLNCQLQVVNLLHTPQSERFVKAQRLVSEEAKLPFNLERSPLVRVTLLQLDSTEYVFVLTAHHIIFDGWSVGVFYEELATLYEAFCTSKPTVLPELPVQYADFTIWQRHWLTPEVLQTQLNYWKQQLKGAPALLELPTDRLRPAIQTNRGAYQSSALSFDLSQNLADLSRRTGVTLFMTLLAAFQTLLYRYTEQTDICVGTPIANRSRPEIEGLIGFFINRLVLRTSLSGNPSFEDLLSRVRDVALGAYAHQDVPFEKLVEELQPARDLSYTPLVQVIFGLNAPTPQIQMAGLTVSPLDVETTTAKFDLILSLENTATGLTGQWEYNSDLFDATTIARMAGHFQTLLSGIVSNPTRRLSDLPLLREQERQQLLVEWNNTFAAFPTTCIHQLFEAVVEREPDAIAVVFEDKQLTYRELNQRANQLAHHLKTLGVEPEVLVGICVERSLEMVVSLLGILKAGGAYLPLDPALPKESLAFRLQDAQVPILLTQKGLIKREDAQVQTVLYLDADWELIAQESDANPKSEVTPENLAYVLYTSGSTGQPKGVAIEHRQILNYLHAILDKLQLPTGASFANVSTFAADLGNTVIFPALCTGGCLHIVSQRATDPKALAEYFGHHPIDCLKITPAHLATLLVSDSSDSILPRQCLVLGGEAANWDLIEKIQQYAPNCRILNHYGPTETTVGVLTYPVSNKQASYNSKTVPIGRPIANTQVYILDRHQQPVPIGIPGELHIGGASLARGYLNRPDLTAEKFINSFNGNINTRLYKTGDLVRYLTDGNIEFLGRLDRQVKIRGFRIELAEIEAVLAQHPEVRDTVVLAWEDEPDNKRLVAYVVPNHEPPATSELRHFLKQKLPDYMVPGAFVMLSSLPLTPNGKVDHGALKAPDTELSDSIVFVPPRDTVEQQLQRIWSEVLKLPTVGVKDNFFTLGGHSLLAVLLMAQISRHFGKNLPIATLFSSPTIEQLASCLRSETHSKPWSPLVAIQKSGDKRPFFFVPGVGGNVIYLYELARHLGSEQPFYGLQARGLDGESQPFTKLEEIASYYIEAIQTVQPTGPYLLGGHSFGGVVAFEMATQLHKQGHKVALLAMIDAFAPIVGQKSKGIDEDDAAYLTDFARYIGYMCSKDLEVSQETLSSLTAMEQLHYLKERLIQVNLLPPDAGITSVRGLVQVYKASLKAYRVYLPSGLQQTPITLFRCNEVDVFEGDTEELTQRLKESALGWNEFSSTIDTHIVPGNHMTMMQLPHVQVLAAQLLSCLEQAQA